MTTYYDLFMNQFFTTLGQVTAVTVSASFVVPMYQYYSLKFKSWLLSENDNKFSENYQGHSYENVDSGVSDIEVEDHESEDNESDDLPSEEATLVDNMSVETSASEPRTI